MLTNYKYAEGAKVSKTSIQDAAVKAGHAVNLATLGMHIKRIWDGGVKKELLQITVIIKNLGKFSPSNEERLLEINEQAVSTINHFLQLNTKVGSLPHKV